MQDYRKSTNLQGDVSVEPVERVVATAPAASVEKSSNPFTRWTGLFLAFSIVMLGCFIGTHFAFDEIRNMVIKHFTIITGPDSYLYDVWQNPASRDVYPLRKYTFFNLTNADEVLNNGSAPNYELLGPYCYQEHIEKYDIRFSNDSSSVKYKYRNYFTYSPSCSQIEDATYTNYGPATSHPYHEEGRPLTEDDEIVMPNMALFGMRYRLGLVPEEMEPFLSKEILCNLLSWVVSNQSVSNTSLFVKVKVKEILWGYPDPLWTLFHPELTLLQYHASTHMLVQWNNTYPVPTPYTHRSGQLCPLVENYTGVCNNTINQDTEELTGADDYQNAGIITQWAGQKQLWWWGPGVDGWTAGNEVNPRPLDIATAYGEEAYPSPYADECPINFGNTAMTNGIRWGPIDVAQKGKKLSAYADFCFRGLDLAYETDADVDGIPALRFGMPPEGLLNSTFNKKCYQQERVGFYNFSQTVLGPVTVVKNWFLDAPYNDDEINITFSVPSPNGTAGRMPIRQYVNTFLAGTDSALFRQRYDSFIDVEPLTGTTVRAHVQGVAVTDLGEYQIDGCHYSNGAPWQVNMSWAMKLPKTMVPIIVLERVVSLPDGLASELRTRLLELFLARIAVYCGMGAGALGIILTLLWVFVKPDFDAKRGLANKARDTTVYSGDSNVNDSLIPVPLKE